MIGVALWCWFLRLQDYLIPIQNRDYESLAGSSS